MAGGAISHTDKFVPALGYRGLTSLYDPLLRWTMREPTFRAKLIRGSRIRSGDRVLDLGCGTGSLTIAVKQTRPESGVVGIDADKEVLAIAQAKASAAHLKLDFYQGYADRLPFPENSFDRVLSSLLFHHLSSEAKRRALEESLRVLRPGGELHIVDWGKPANGFMRLAFLAVQVLDGFATTAESVKGVLPRFVEAAGFEDIRETGSLSTIFGTLRFYQGRKRPDSAL